MRRIHWFLLVAPLVACNSGKGELDDDDDGVDLGDAGDVADLCEEEEPETVTLTVEFPATSGGCDWGEDGNLDPSQGIVTARLEQTDSLELPDDAVICDVTFDFEGITGGEGTPMVYDDNFFFTFNGVVLAASYGPMVESLPSDDIYYTYDWEALAGTGFEFDDRVPTYCLGEDEGLSVCEIPPPETNGVMSLQFDSGVVNELAFRAIEAGAYDFTFVTIGDNDDTDCYHEDFAFTVEIPYVTY